MNKLRKRWEKPLYVRAAEILRKMILTSGQPGQKLESESKMAARLGVSLLTLRHAVGALAHEGLVERRQGSGTYVADLAAQRHVAIMNYAAPNIHGPAFQLRVYHLLGSVLHKRGYRHRFYVWAPAEAGAVCPDFVEETSRDRVCGAAFVAMHPAPALPILQEKQIPFVVTGETELPQAFGVATDFPQMVRDGTRHLLDQGCRGIALMQWSSGRAGDRVIEAFQSALAERGAKFEPRWVRSAVPPNVPGAGWEQFREIWSAQAEKPDGLLVTDDVLFRDVALGILDSGIKVPEQLQVVTQTNKGSGISYPFPVARLEIDPQEHAEALADSLVRLMKKETASGGVRFIRARLLPLLYPVTSPQETMRQ